MSSYGIGDAPALAPDRKVLPALLTIVAGFTWGIVLPLQVAIHV